MKEEMSVNLDLQINEVNQKMNSIESKLNAKLDPAFISIDQ